MAANQPTSSFEILTINTAFTRYSACKRLAAMEGPDFTNASTIGSVLTFIPGVLVGFVGFLVFGTTSFFRKIYAESLRDCCGRRKAGIGAFEREMEDARSWSAMGNGRGRQATYHCRVQSVGNGMEGKRGGRGFEAKTFEAQKSPQQCEKLAQPWKTLGIDSPVGTHPY